MFTIKGFSLYPGVTITRVHCIYIYIYIYNYIYIYRERERERERIIVRTVRLGLLASLANNDVTGPI